MPPSPLSPPQNPLPRIELTVAALAGLGADRLANFILDHCSRDLSIHKAASRMLRHRLAPTQIYTETIKRIEALSSGSGFYAHGQARQMDHETFDIVRTIREELTPVSVEEAVQALQFLVERNEKIIESLDTSNDEVYPHLQDAVALLGELWAQIPQAAPANVAQYVYERVSNNGYGVFDRIISKFKKLLDATGLRQLETLFQADITTKSDEYNRNGMVEYLREIADAEGDVDKFLAIVREYPGKNSQYDSLQCAKRLANVGRAQEALALMESVPTATPAWKSDIDATLMRCYETFGDKSKLQEILECQFFEAPSTESLLRLLTAVGGTEANRERYINTILNSSTNEYLLMKFLLEIQDGTRLAALVRKNIGCWDGGRYYTLAPAALFLETAAPLEATVLYRALVNDILQRANSRYYHHAARYLARLQVLEGFILSYAPIVPHIEYMSEMREKHKRKNALRAAIGGLGN